MKLSVAERIGLLQILPKEGNYVTLKVVHDLKLNLAFSEEEIKDWDIKTQIDPLNKDRQITTWSLSKAQEKEVEFGDSAMEIVVVALKGFDEKGKLDESLFSLYEKFVFSGG
jgi:hypothetical protein